MTLGLTAGMDAGWPLWTPSQQQDPAQHYNQRWRAGEAAGSLPALLKRLNSYLAAQHPSPRKQEPIGSLRGEKEHPHCL